MSEITPAEVAQALLGGSMSAGAVDVLGEEDVLCIEFTPLTDGRWDKENVQHFRAVVVEGETVPVVLDPDEYRAGVDAIVRQLSDALLKVPFEEYPIHLALTRGRLYALAGAARAEQDGGQADG